METKQHEKKRIKSSDTIIFSRSSRVKSRRKKRTKLGANLSSDASQKILKL